MRLNWCLAQGKQSTLMQVQPRNKQNSFVSADPLSLNVTPTAVS